jgi:hypothetical protein
MHRAATVGVIEAVAIPVDQRIRPADIVIGDAQVRSVCPDIRCANSALGQQRQVPLKESVIGLSGQLKGRHAAGAVEGGGRHIGVASDRGVGNARILQRQAGDIPTISHF